MEAEWNGLRLKEGVESGAILKLPLRFYHFQQFKVENLRASFSLVRHEMLFVQFLIFLVLLPGWNIMSKIYNNEYATTLARI